MWSIYERPRKFQFCPYDVLSRSGQRSYKIVTDRIILPSRSKKSTHRCTFEYVGVKKKLLKRLDIVISLLLSFIVEHSLQTKVVLELFYVYKTTCSANRCCILACNHCIWGAYLIFVNPPSGHSPLGGIATNVFSLYITILPSWSRGFPLMTATVLQ